MRLLKSLPHLYPKTCFHLLLLKFLWLGFLLLVRLNIYSFTWHSWNNLCNFTSEWSCKPFSPEDLLLLFLVPLFNSTISSSVTQNTHWNVKCSCVRGSYVCCSGMWCLLALTATFQILWLPDVENGLTEMFLSQRCRCFDGQTLELNTCRAAIIADNQQASLDFFFFQRVGRSKINCLCISSRVRVMAPHTEIRPTSPGRIPIKIHFILSWVGDLSPISLFNVSLPLFHGSHSFL